MTITKKQFFLSATIYLLFWLTISGRITHAQTNIIDYRINTDFVEYKYTTTPITNKEIINSSTEKISENTYKIYSGEQFYNDNGQWYQLETATTTTDKFTIPITFSLIKKAIADTIYPITDGSIFCDNGTWENCHDATNGETLDGSGGGGGGSDELFIWYGTGYNSQRSFLKFDTSIVGSGNQVDSASIFLKRAEASGTGYYNIYGSDATTIDLANGTYSSCDPGSATPFVDTDIETWTNNTYAEFVFNTTGKSFINKTGNTMFCAMESADAESHTAPTGAAYIGINAESTAGTASDPYMIITYSLAPTPTPTPTPTATTTPYLSTSTSTDLIAQSIITLTSWILLTTTALIIIAIYKWIL